MPSQVTALLSTYLYRLCYLMFDAPVSLLFSLPPDPSGRPRARARSCRVWFRSSVFLPLLALRPATRAALIDDVALAPPPPPAEHILRLLTAGVCVTGAKLFVQLYFLLRVAQTGLVWSNWLRYALSSLTTTFNEL